MQNTKQKASTKQKLTIAAIFGAMGPGLLAALSGNDAGGIATYSSAGASYGYKMLWMLPVMTVLLIVTQETAARCGCVTGKGLASLIRERFGVRRSVLAMAALKLGAEHATAFDFDPMAIEVARHNMVRNAVTAEQLDLFVEDVFKWKPSESQQGDLVVANLFSTILQKAFPQIIAAMKKDAALVISGILASQWEETKTAAERHGLFFERAVKRGKWITAKGGMAR